MAAATATAARALLAGTSFVDCESSTVLVLTVQAGNRRLSFLVIAHLDKAEAFRAAGVPVHDDLGRLHRAVRSKHCFQIAVGYPIREIADVQLLAHCGPPVKKACE